jgi:hypothetical protein
VSVIPSSAVPEPTERRTWLVLLFPLRFLGLATYAHADAVPGEPTGYLAAFGSRDGCITLSTVVEAEEAGLACVAWRAETVESAAVRLAAARASRIILAHASSLVRHGDPADRPPRPPSLR